MGLLYIPTLQEISKESCRLHLELLEGEAPTREKTAGIKQRSATCRDSCL